ncbi:aconitate hydratase 1 [Streptomyces sp. IMTB 2501]|uniref:aconitate hydratase AcnA n=1 Tax=Streptomyces sp. IMTB 2501 TaxID=1776340 RepID=UPI00096FD75A|nr:aconitate hydratase AcnA [Streptomyces sp. IMTB 2501]OLZ72905.1 aconitate hydratase 1 [Streptomyces sp. IMTB 2501]
MSLLTTPTGLGHRVLSLRAAEAVGLPGLDDASITTRILVENVLRLAERGGDPDEAIALADAIVRAGSGEEVDAAFDFHPSRLLLQDHSGVPVLADLASLRELLAERGLDPGVVSPALPVDLVVDHSVEADEAGSRMALARNMGREMRLNAERFRFLKWARQSMAGVRIVPPGHGIIHQIHLERLARVVGIGGDGIAAPDTVFGTDSHTPMVNSIGVLGWGIGGLDASAVLLGMPVSLLARPVVGVWLTGRLPAGTTAMDLALTLTEVLRAHGVVHRMVEFRGPGALSLSVTDRATVANMAPEYGCTSTLFPVDARTIEFLRLTGRTEEELALVEGYSRYQGLFVEEAGWRPAFAETIELDLATVEPSAAGPRRPQDRVPLARVPKSFESEVGKGSDEDGMIAIAAITSCTNTSNQTSMMLAGLLARNAVARGLKVPAWVKTSLAPGSRSVTGYLEAAGLLPALSELGFDVVAYGCTTCIGNSGPLHAHAARSVSERGTKTVAVLSGNRNFEGRIHQQVAAAYLMSPPLVVAYALAGHVRVDLTSEPLGTDSDGCPVMLADLWPTAEEVDEALGQVTLERYTESAQGLFEGDESWQALESPVGARYDWPTGSSYLTPLPLISLDGDASLEDVRGARALVNAEHSTTTDHISPAGQIRADSVAGLYLSELGVPEAEFNTFGCRRGNHEVLVRGTFAGAGMVNRLADRKGGFTRHFPTGEQTTVYEAATRYRQESVPLIVLGGRAYGMGSSRDWAAKGPRLLGVRAVLAESFERIHRSNLVAVGIVPLEFAAGEGVQSLGITGEERFDVTGLEVLEPGGKVNVRAYDESGAEVAAWTMTARVDTRHELDCVRRGGVFGVIADTMIRTKG